MLTKEERVRRALASADVDRPPYSFWRHFPGEDHDPDTLVDRTRHFAADLDVDFVKAMSNGLYCVEDWGGVADDGAIDHGGVGHVAHPPVVTAADWRRIERLPVSAPALDRELRHLAALAKALGRQTPLVATVFSPLTIAHKLAGDGLARDVRQAPTLVLQTLEQIALTVADFARQALAVGCAGIYFAVQDADPALFDDATYALFGETFDRMVLDAAGAGWFNIVHMHGDRILFDRLKTYPVAALNWHIGETPPSLAAYRREGGTRPIVGGLRRAGLTQCDMRSVKADLAGIRAATAGRGILLSPGCVIRHPVDIAFLKQVAAQIKRGVAATEGEQP